MEGRLLHQRPIATRQSGVRAGVGERRFAFAPGLVLAVRGDRATLEHFGAEYGSAAVETMPEAPVAVEVDIEIVGRLGADDARAERSGSDRTGGIELRDGHRTTRWRAHIGPPDEPTLHARIAASGLFGRSFVQGFVVEPLLSVAAARGGRMLLPGAGLVLEEGLVLVLGPSHVGKTTLAARALAAGHAILGDDQVLLQGDGLVRPFPRRMRLYSDLGSSAPAAHRALPTAIRVQLALRSAAEMIVGRRLSLPVLARVPAVPHPAMRPARILLVERSAGASPAIPRRVGDAGELEAVPVGQAEMRRVVLALANEQRERLAAAASDDWNLALHAVSALEAGLIRSALAGVPAQRVVIPAGWDAARSASALARTVGLP